MSAIIETMQEMDSRSADGLTITLLFQPQDGSVWVEIMTAEDCEIFEVPADEAMQAFHHPFVYAAANSHGHGVTV